ncbi:UDP-glycosyltransferase 87A1-like isoform X2 [Rhododendron vialii]|uniref:UDP-glycosyltransferase 87A1-like isoform X2 n=1 Tax=Rhododendron vialii TaxID=182163 RepID=UPI00265EA927|nr:UDP-glycosyltransferase 87A1-like isoform X2 [Rhododendron vialii]
MEPNNKPTTICHVVAMPYPGRGHINPMMNFCKLLASKRDEILITFVVTEEWLGFLSSEPKPPANIRFATIPNVVPSEKGRAADLPGFIRAVLTKMEEPFERLLERLERPQKPSVIMHDTYLMWAVDVGNRRNIPVASFWTQQMSVFTVFYHFDLLKQNGHFPINVSERGNELVNYIPGIPPTRIADLPAVFSGKVFDVVHTACEALSLVRKVQYLLLTSIYELESQTIDAIKAAIPTPVYSIGPSVPYYELGDNSSASTDSKNCETSYVQWLDSHPKSSVLYISLGSFLSVSRTQMDEIIAGVDMSCVRFFWVSRDDASRIKEGCGDLSNKGVVVPWCDQLKVLCHSSTGGFWSHCGWNSTKEGVFAGIPFLTYPIIGDQMPNSKTIVEDWKIGWKVRRGMGDEERLVTREEIASILRRFMDLESDEGKEMRRKAKELEEISRRAVSEGGSAETAIDSFIQDIS